MSAKRLLLGMVSVFCASVAGIMLPVAVPYANADELSDLRANSGILQQRLDEIDRARAVSAAALNAGGPADGAAASGSFPRSFRIPGTRTSVRVGGRISETVQWKDGSP